MKLKNIGLSIVVISVLGLGFTGCGSSSNDTIPEVETQTSSDSSSNETTSEVETQTSSDSSSSDTTPEVETQTGTFVDSPVQGLNYITVTQNGYTNDKGEFKYVSGETVEFKLGNLSLGKKVGSSLMTPYTLGDSNITNPSIKTTNIAMLLQSLDGNRSNGNILDLSKLKDYNFTDINIGATTNEMTTKIANLFVDNSFSSFRDISNNTPVNATTANSTMKTHVENEENSRTISVENGFGTKWLDGRTIYSVLDNTIQAFKFENNILTITPASTLQFPYTITNDGILKVDESVSSEKTVDSDNRYQKYKILSIDNTKIFTCQDDGAVLENCEIEDNQQLFFTTKKSAQTYLDSL